MSEPAPVQLFLGGCVELHPGDCRERIKALPDASIDSVVTDPPYALVSIGKRFGKTGSAPAKVPEGGSGAYARASAGFMGQAWDTGETAFAMEFWREVLRVLKPGGHLVAFSGTRTYHRMVVAIEDAGFEIRDQGKFDHAGDSERDAFLASLNEEQYRQFVKLFAEADDLGQLAWVYGSGFPKSHDVSKAIDRHNGDEREKIRVTHPRIANMPSASTGEGRPWLEAALQRGFHEKDGDIPASAASAAWEGWGTALKPAWEPIVLARKPLNGTVAENVLAHGTGALNVDACRVEDGVRESATGGMAGKASPVLGAFTGPKAEPVLTTIGRWPANIAHDGSEGVVTSFPNDVARFFYTAKADAHDRIGSKHPTVKPVDLMQWLVRMITPPGGTVLDPFAGTGTTGEAAWREGFSAILIEREADYQADIARRMALAVAGPAERRSESIKARGRLDVDAGPLFGGSAEAVGGGGRTVYGTFARDAQSARSGSSGE
jgi:DNA modification methylase